MCMCSNVVTAIGNVRYVLLHCCTPYLSFSHGGTWAAILYTLCTVNSKINGIPKSVYLPISKQHSILVVANLLANNNITINYCMQVNSLGLKSNVASKWASKHLMGYHLFCCWLYIIYVCECWYSFICI